GESKNLQCVQLHLSLEVSLFPSLTIFFAFGSMGILVDRVLLLKLRAPSDIMEFCSLTNLGLDQ
ncbi:9538_t:CDS:1, partial [Dentiscutata erythropus]